MGKVVPVRNHDPIEGTDVNEGTFGEVGNKHAVQESVLSALPSTHGRSGALAASTEMCT